MDQGARESWARSVARSRQQQEELAVVEGEPPKVDAAIERYLLAFEAGTMPETQCGERVRSLGIRAADLRNRRADLADADAAEMIPPSADELTELRALVSEAVERGPSASTKSLLQALTAEVRVQHRQAITPWSKIPANGASSATAVRAPSRSVGAEGLEPPTPSL